MPRLESVDPCGASEIIQALGVTLGADGEFLVSRSASCFGIRFGFRMRVFAQDKQTGCDSDERHSVVARRYSGTSGVRISVASSCDWSFPDRKDLRDRVCQWNLHQTCPRAAMDHSWPVNCRHTCIWNNFAVRRDCFRTWDINSMAARGKDRQCVGNRHGPDQSPPADGTAAGIQENGSFRSAFCSPQALRTLPAIRGRC